MGKNFKRVIKKKPALQLVQVAAYSSGPYSSADIMMFED